MRVVRELLERGCSVRAGVRNVAKAQAVFEGKEAPPGVGYTGKKEARQAPLACDRLSSTTFDVVSGSVEELKAALGDATVVVCCLGAPESEALNPSLPRAIDGEGVMRLVQAAKEAGVKHFVLVSSLGTGKFGWPASVLNLFWNVLDWKRQAELSLIGSGLAFTIVRPGGMERPTDDFADTHGLVLYGEDAKHGGLVSRKQVAQLCAECVLRPGLAAHKILEAIAEEGVPLRSLARQLEAAPEVFVGRPAPAGSATAYTNAHAYTPDGFARFLEAFAFRGAGPEAVNGRAAMLAIAYIGWVEAHGGGSLATQLAQTAHPWPELVAGGVLLASLPPLLRGVTAKDASLGPFSAGVETQNGRLAMLGLALMAVLEWQHGSTVWAHPWPFYN